MHNTQTLITRHYSTNDANATPNSEVSMLVMLVLYAGLVRCWGQEVAVASSTKKPII
jgi:hypothetical protein